MRQSSTFNPTEPEWLDLLTHKSASSDPIELARQKFFIAARLAVGFSVLLLSPISLVLYGLPSPQHTAQFVLALTPLVAVVVLKQTGDMKLAECVSIFGWAALAANIGGSTEGFEAVSLTMLTIALIEAALTLEIGMVAAVVGAILALIALEVSRNPHAPTGFAPRANVALFVTPLMMYMSALAAGAIFMAHARVAADRRNARDLRLLTDSLGDIVVRFDRTGAVSSIVGNMHKTYGLETRDLFGRGFFRRVHVADRPAFLKLVSDAIGRDTTAHAVLRLHVGGIENAQGGYLEPVFNYFDARTCHVRTTAEGDAETEAPVLCILRDVTTARKAEDEIAAARRESELAMAGKTRFLANVSHELRTPLNAIIGFSEMLASEELEPREPEKRREYARIVRDSGNHLHEVVSMILDMSKIESGSMQIFPEPFSLPVLVEQCCDMIQLKADQGHVTLSRDCQGDIEEVVADKRACKQILLNLLSNAVKFTPPHGRVTVRLRPEGNYVALAVTDTGIGIGAEDLARLGDPFFQASSSHDRSYEGTGLGLSVVRGLVGLHGGSIAVESALKLGTVVTVRLPLDGRDRVSPTPKIETIARRHVASPGEDVAQDQDKVKKFA
ncbi:MAG: HAMP domain-containing sensor histidine kinase [Methylocystis sp.]